MCVCAVLQQKGYKICPRNPCGLRNSLVRVQNVVGRTSWGRLMLTLQATLTLTTPKQTDNANEIIRQ